MPEFLRDLLLRLLAPSSPTLATFHVRSADDAQRLIDLEIRPRVDALSRAVATAERVVHEQPGDAWEAACGRVVEEVDPDTLAAAWRAAKRGLRRGYLERDDPKLRDVIDTEQRSWARLSGALEARRSVDPITAHILRSQIVHTGANSVYSLEEIFDPKGWAELSRAVRRSRERARQYG